MKTRGSKELWNKYGKSALKYTSTFSLHFSFELWNGPFIKPYIPEEQINRAWQKLRKPSRQYAASRQHMSKPSRMVHCPCFSRLSQDADTITYIATFTSWKSKTFLRHTAEKGEVSTKVQPIVFNLFF